MTPKRTAEQQHAFIKGLIEAERLKGETHIPLPLALVDQMLDQTLNLLHQIESQRAQLADLQLAILNVGTPQ
jgi:hypothetical protein